MECKLDAAVEVIVDYEQGIDKFWELVWHHQKDTLELRERRGSSS